MKKALLFMGLALISSLGLLQIARAEPIATPVVQAEVVKTKAPEPVSQEVAPTTPAKEETTVETTQPVAPTPPTPGTCDDWIAQAGITDTVSAKKLIMRESSCNPNAVNPSSQACGLGQQLPCGKWEHQWNEPVGALIDMQKYVFDRYGSWANALAFHYANGWY